MTDAPGQAALPLFWLQRQRARLLALTGKQRAFLLWFSGAVSVLAFAPFHVFPILFITLPLLVWQLDAARSGREAAWAGWWFGFGYFLFNLFWIGEAFLVEADKFAWMLPFAVTLLPAGLALFWALAAYGAWRLWPAGTWRVLTLAIAIAFVEWLRGHVLTGLPWNVIGYALTYPLELMQSASIAGVYALSLPAVLIFAFPLVRLGDAQSGATRGALLQALAAGLVPLVLLWGYGAWRLGASPPSTVPGVMLRLVQPSVPQREKWLPEKQREIFDLHLDLSAGQKGGILDAKSGITHVIWPEAAMPFLPLEYPEALAAIGALLPDGTALIAGALRRDIGTDGPQRGYNSMMAFDSEGKLRATYDKVHLVPFGEYLPLAPVLTALGLSKLTHGLGAFDQGPLPRPLLAIPGLPPAGGLICYEVLFPGAVIDDANRPALLINLTNDGWFGDTSGPRQHFHQTRVRAVEEGLPVVRVANNGISATIDSHGRVLGRIDLDERGIVDTGLPTAAPPTAYFSYRDSVFFGMLAFCCLMLLRTRRRIL